MSPPHHNHAGHSSEGSGSLAVAVGLNMLLTVGQIAGGIVSGSLALIADALHNLNDATALGVALIARRVSRKPADRSVTFGYRRAEVVGTLINLTALVMVGLYLVYEAIMRFFDPQPVGGWIMIGVAGVAFVVDAATAFLTGHIAHGGMNVAAAFVHNLADAAGSLAVILSGVLILWLGWKWTDPAATLLIAGYVLFQGLRRMPPAIRILMEAAPPGLDVDEVVAAMRAVEGVRDVHHVHLWQLDEDRRALEAHVVTASDRPEDQQRVKAVLKRELSERFEIGHSTLELELPDETLPDVGGGHEGVIAEEG